MKVTQIKENHTILLTVDDTADIFLRRERQRTKLSGVLKHINLGKMLQISKCNYTYLRN